MMDALLVNAFLVNGGLLALGAALASVPIIIHLLNRRRVRRVRWAAMQWLLAAMKRHQRRLRLENWLILFLRVAAIILLGLALARPVMTDSALAGLFGGKRSVYLVLDNSYSVETKTDARSVFEKIKHEADLVLSSLGPEDSLAVVMTNDPGEDVSSGLDPHVLIPRTVGGEGVARAKETVATLRPRQAPARWNEVLELVRDQMEVQDVNRQVVVVTDLQAKDWLRRARETVAAEDGADGDAPAAADVGIDRLKERLIEVLRMPSAVQILDTGGADRRNLGVTAIHDRTARGAFVGRPLNLEVTVANYGPKPVEGAMLEVYLGERPTPTRHPIPTLAAAQTGLRIPVPSLERVPVDLPRTTFDEPGSHWLRVVVVPPRTDTGADVLGRDSERWFALRVRRRIQVLAWTHTSAKEKGSADVYLRGIYEGDPGSEASAVLGPAPLFGFRGVGTENELVRELRAREREPVDLVVLANVVPRNRTALGLLKEFVREGGGLLVFTGDRNTTPGGFNEAFHGDDPTDRLSPFPIRAAEYRDAGRDERPFRFDFSEQDDAHPMAQPFADPEAGDWIRRMPPAIWGRTAFEEPADAEGAPGEPGRGSDDVATDPEATGTVVLRFADGPPAVAAGTFGEGSTLWVATSIDHGWLDMAVFPFLPVFLEEAGLFLTRPRAQGRNLEVGSRLRASIPAGADGARFAVPGGGRVLPTRRVDPTAESGRATVFYDGVGAAGLWRLTYRVQGPTGETEPVEEHFAVNVDPHEGALARGAEADVREGIPPELDLSFPITYGETQEELQQAREGEITRVVLWVLLALLLLESLLAMRFGRRSAASQTSTTP